MAKRKFAPHERFAVFTVHGEICYMCRKPLDFAEFEVDHVLPEDLADDPERLARELATLNRPPTYNLNDYENWLPVCAPCNTLKRNRVWEPSLLVQMCLQIAAEKAPQAREMARRQVANRKLNKALAILEQLLASGQLSDDQAQHVAGLLAFQQRYRHAHLKDEPVILTPKYSMEMKDQRVTLVSSPSALRRRLILQVYGFTCVVTGPGQPAGLEVASIVPHHEWDADPGVRGFLVLRADVHRLFDQGLIAIDPDALTVLVSQELRDSQYAEFHGKQAKLPAEPDYWPDPRLLAVHASRARTPFIGGERPVPPPNE